MRRSTEVVAVAERWQASNERKDVNWEVEDIQWLSVGS